MKIFNTNKSSNLERKKNIIPYMIPDINKKGWQFAFMMKLNRNAGLMNKFKLLSRYISNQTLSFNDFSDIIIKFFGKKWGNDIVDIAYFYNDIYRNNIILEKNENGTIKNIICNNALDNININDKIIDYFNYNKLSNILF
jgi:hypothetical protein